MSLSAGLVIGLGDKIVYHLGDTALFSDLELVGKRDRIDVALMPHRRPLHDGPPRRGHRGAADQARLIVPCHYDTFPPIETDARAFQSEVESGTDSRVAVLDPGETHSI